METYNRDRYIKGIDSYDIDVEKSTGRDFTFGLAVGLLVGVVGGLFLAPKSGDDLRDDLNRIKDTVNNDSDESLNLSETLDEKLSGVKEKFVNKKAEMAEKSRVKKLDESEVQAQQRAIKDEVSDDNLKNANVVDMSKYKEQ